jgi:hypothetical protein
MNSKEEARQRQQGSMDAVGTTRAHNCQTEESFRRNAELLVLLNLEKTI